MKEINPIERLPCSVIEKTAKNARYYRILRELVKGKGLTSKQIASISGASNPYSEIENLRKLGWRISNTHHKGIDRDKKRCCFDRYHLSSEQALDVSRLVNLVLDHRQT